MNINKYSDVQQILRFALLIHFLPDLSTIIALNCRPLTNLSFDSLLEVAETLFAANVNFDDFAAEWLMPDMST